MSWEDTFQSNIAALGSSWNRLPSQATTYKAKAKSYGYDYGSHNVGWSQIASGNIGAAVGTPRRDTENEAWKQPPAKVNVTYPTSYGQQRAPVQPPTSTQGDVFGSIAAAVGGTAGNLNLANIVPWFMERVAVLAHEAKDSGVPGLTEFGTVSAAGLDGFTAGVQVASDAMGPVMEWFPNYVRDGQLHDRSKIYAAMVNGGPVDWGANGGGLLGTGLLAGPIGNPIESAGELWGSAFDLMTGKAGRDYAEGIVQGRNPLTDRRIAGSVSAQANAYNEYRDVLLHSVDPNKRLNAETAMNLLREAIDIPQSVKIALEAKPSSTDEDIQAALDAAPEGRAWSYSAGPKNTALNMGTPLLFYAAEAIAAYGVGGVVGTAGAKLGVGAQAGSAAAITSRAIGLTGKGITTAAKLQTWAFKAGVGATVLTTTADAVARTVGAQAAVDWFDEVNRSTIISDNLNVQLVTSFSVNPLAGSKAAAKGILQLGNGAGNIVIGKVLGEKLLKMHTQDAFLNGMVKRLYGLDSDASAAAWMDDPTHLDRGQSLEQVLAIAMEDHYFTLPAGEKAHIVALPAQERMQYLYSTYLPQAMKILEDNPQGMVDRWKLRSAEYHGFIGGFDSPVAALNARDYRMTSDLTLSLRSDIDAVVGYREALPPQGQALARQSLDAMVDADGTIATRGVNSVNHLINDFPVLRTFWQGKITGEARVPRATVERMIDEATAHYQSLQRENPIRARTGRDPVIRPSSPSHTRDIADAVGTNIDTIKAIDAADVAEVGLVRQYLTERGWEPAKLDAMTPEDVMLAGDVDLAQRIKPWAETGAKVETAERALADLRSTAATLRREGHHGQAKRVDLEAAKMAGVIADAGDPLRPFALAESLASEARFSKDIMTRAARKVDARVRLGVIESLKQVLHKADMDVPSLESVVVAADGSLAWAPDIAAVPSPSILDAFVRFKTSGPYMTIRKTVGHYNAKHTEEIFTEKAQAFIDLADQGTPGQQWQAMADSPGFVAYLRKQGDEVLGEKQGMTSADGLTGNAAADLLESMNLARGRTSRSLAQVAESMGLEPQVALSKLAEMKRAYHDALDGRTEASLRTSRDRIKVSDDAIAQAEANRAVRDAVFDPEYEAWGLPQTVARVAEITANPTDQAMWSALRGLMESDATVADGLEAVAARAGLTVDDILADASHADAVRAELVPPDFIPPEPGVIREQTALDTAIRNGDDLSVEGLVKKFEEAHPVRVTGTTAAGARSTAATLAKRIPKLRKSYKYQTELDNLGVGAHVAPDAAVLADPRNALGLDVMSILNYGVMGTRPQTLGGVIEILRLIENRHASAVGIGTDMAAEAQRVAKRILDTALGQARKEITYEAGGAGMIGPGIRGIDHLELGENMTRLLKYDDANPLATLQYGLKKRPKDALVQEWAAVPGLAEELVSKTFKPWQERVWTAQVRQVYNTVFGPTSNASLRAATKLRFVELAAARGVDVAFADDLFDVWQKNATISRTFRVGRTPKGQIKMELGDNPMYADVWNIPNDRLNVYAHGNVEGDIKGLIGELSSGSKPKIDAATALAYGDVDFADLFRTAGSFTKRELLPKVPGIGRELAQMYGTVAHNKAFTTYYFMFRFGLDVRFHAQNFFEASILSLGMAGFRKREFNFGEFGMDSNYLRHLDSADGALANTGIPITRSRHQTAYNTFLKLKPDALRGEVRDWASKGLDTEDPSMIQLALEQMRHEPVTKDMIAGIKADPDDFIKELDAWHAKMLKNASLDEDAAVIDATIADALAETPELAEAFARLADVNKQTWDDIRHVVYGNPERSRAERLLNSYWLYWPLSYQIKSTKWLANVLLDSAGGLPTNASGAWLFDKMATTHQQQLATNPGYQEWFEKHPSLVFVAQMLMPVSFDSVGVSLNPFVRDTFFGGRKEVMGVGPIYTWEGVVKPVVKESYVDLYPVFGDLLMNYTGQKPSKTQREATGQGLTPP